MYAPSLFISFIIVALILTVLRYRIPRPGSSEIIEGEILYRAIDLDSSFRHNIIEPLLGSTKIWLTSGIALYVSRRDYIKLYPEPIDVMYEKNYTIEAKFRVRRLMFGGYAPATVISTTNLEKPPVIQK